MIQKCKLYKDISIKIIDDLNKGKLDNIERLLDERQILLEKEDNSSEFKKILMNDGILDIDKNIHKLLSENIDRVKCEIREHKRSERANNSYINFNKEKLNIFNEKV
ncbi:flagellar protein FliT [Romboutsia sedimentorum]|uniref:Flagellar protein FliT n=1 Tax=Romboutsia sedimentorum TaxID=1368474 RepID=A0ABT7E6Y8_9FIRM|nr:flagellar protein FliT [Romboutsia sedimentorum]MDK2562699.1 flagellar protein FliT [Romboutsia sedimentorum]